MTTRAGAARDGIVVVVHDRLFRDAGLHEVPAFALAAAAVEVVAMHTGLGHACGRQLVEAVLRLRRLRRALCDRWPSACASEREDAVRTEGFEEVLDLGSCGRDQASDERLQRAEERVSEHGCFSWDDPLGV